jgi:hypothetical protein
VTPRAVACTVDPRLPSGATLRFTVYNSSTADVRCTAVEFTLPVGRGEDDLTPDPATLAPSADDAPGWRLDHVGGGRLVAVPEADVTVPAGRVLTFVVAGVRVSDDPGISVIPVTEHTEGTHPARTHLHEARATTLTVARLETLTPGR